jgi:hypothetical protein
VAEGAKAAAEVAARAMRAREYFIFSLVVDVVKL